MFDVLTPDAMYCAGLLATDGCMSNCLGKKTIAFGCCDLDTVEWVANFLGGQVNKKLVKGGRDQWRVRVCRQNSYDALVSFGITERKSLTMRVSELLARDRNFWRGAIDGDGTIVCRSGKYFAMNLCSSSLSFIEQFAADAGTLALHPLVKSTSQPSGHNNYAVTFSGISCLRMLTELYSTPCFAMARKKALADDCISQEPYYRNGRLSLTPAWEARNYA
jgi:hypothetical protein